MILRGIIILLTALVSVGISAQRNKDQKVYSYQPDLEYSFNRSLDKDKGIPKANLYRDDLLYHSESAYVTPDDRGNYSLLKYSRFGIGHDIEISTNIGEDAFRPIVGAKREWGQWGKLNIFSSALSLSTFYPGYLIARKAGMEKICDENTHVIKVLELGHEFIYSHIWSSDPNCSTGNPYMVLSFGFGTYWGIRLSNDVMSPIKHRILAQNREARGNKVIGLGDFLVSQMADEVMPPIGYHVLAQRSATYGDKGFRMHLKGWADGYINSWLTLHGGMWLQCSPTLKHPVSLEARVEAEAFLTPRVSVSLGAIGSLGNFVGVKTLAMGYPMFDVSFYFGKKKNMSGLFDLKF